MTMSQGCAGFFTDEALDAAGQGIVKTALDLSEIAGIRPEDWSTFVPMADRVAGRFAGGGPPPGVTSSRRSAGPSRA